MKVYSVISEIPHEGRELLGVFADYISAKNFIEMKKKKHEYCYYGIVKSELDQEIDVDFMVDWI